MSKKQVLKSEFWLEQGRKDIFEPWFKHMIDQKNKLFHIKMDRDWKPLEFTGKVPWVISRQVFALSAGYLLYGKDEYLDQARIAVDWLLQYAWDQEYGGWFDLLSAEGKVLDEDKTQFNYMYTDTGLIFYYFLTHDKQVLDIVNCSTEIRKEKWWDQENGGFYKELNRDLSVKNSDKDFGGQFVQLSGPGFYHYLATGDQKVVKQLEKVLDTSLDRMVDPDSGWILEDFDHDWNYLAKKDPDYEVDMGHNMEAAWCAFRLAGINGNRNLIDKAQKFVELAFRWGFDKKTGLMQYRRPEDKRSAPKKYTHWWVQEYANFITLFQYHLTGEKFYLDKFIKTTTFWNKYFIDKRYGGEYLSVEFEKDKIKREQRPRTAYHSAEHVMLLSFYLDLFVNRKPVELNFRLSAKEGDKHYVSPVEDKNVRIKSVIIDNQNWDDFNARERWIRLTAGENMKVQVILENEK